MRLFISYSQNDIATLTLLVNTLRKMRHQVFFGEGLGVNTSEWQPQLQTEIEQSSAFICTVSQSTNADHWCQWEYWYATQIGKPIIPILLDTSPLPAGLKPEMCVDLTRGFTQAARNALNARLKSLDIHVSPEQVPAISSKPSGVPAHAIVQAIEAKPKRLPLSEDEKTHRSIVIIGIILVLLGVGAIATYIIDYPRMQAEQHIRNAHNIIVIKNPNMTPLPTQPGPTKTNARIAEYDLAATFQPNNPLIYEERGAQYYEDGNYQAAIADYEQLVKLDPKYPFAYARLGALYLNVGDFGKAIAANDAAIALSPDNVSLYLARAYAYGMFNEVDKALADYNYAITLDQQTTKPYDFRAEYYRQLRRYKEAIADFTHALEIDHFDYWALRGRGLVYLALGRLEDAVKDLDLAWRKEPSNINVNESVCVSLARAYDDLKQSNDALIMYKRCLRFGIQDEQMATRIPELEATLTPK